MNLQSRAHPASLPDSVWVCWLGMLLLCVVPFLSSWRTGPLAGLYLEAGSMLFACLLVALSAGYRLPAVRLPEAGVYWLLLAVLLVLQARLLDLPYTSQSDMTAAIFLVLALLSWAVRLWVVRCGQAYVLQVVAWALLLGVLLQSGVCVLQFAGKTQWVPGVLSGGGNHHVFGQLAQRNHLGHYLMWGVLALCYLWHERRLPSWLAAVLLVWITGVMGLVGSRTIVAYALLLLPAAAVWWLYAGRSARRMAGLVCLACTLVLLSQVVMSPLLSWLGGMEFASGVERVGASSFERSGRSQEWQKAWQLFLNQPWWGYGWGSYAYQGFAETGVYAQGFRQYDGTVLFTHCHNLLLQLLAETGALGTLLVVGGFVWVVRRLWARPFSAASMTISLLLLVSLCHSMLEYPLWYVYFLAVFAVLMALTPATAGREEVAGAPRRHWLWLTLALVAGAELVRVGVVYQELLAYGRRQSDVQLRQQQIDDLLAWRQQEYWLRYYADMTVVQKIAEHGHPLPDWGARSAADAGRYRPYSNTFVHGLYLAQAGQAQPAAIWLDQMAHYYPALLPHFIGQAQKQPGSAAIQAQMQAACRDYTRATGSQLACPIPAP